MPDRGDVQNLAALALEEFAPEWEILSACSPITPLDLDSWPSGKQSYQMTLRHRTTGVVKVLGRRIAEDSNALCYRGISGLVLGAYLDGNTDPIRRYLEEIGVVRPGALHCGRFFRRPETRSRVGSARGSPPSSTPPTGPPDSVSVSSFARRPSLPTFFRTQTGRRPAPHAGRAFAGLTVVEMIQAISSGEKTGHLTVYLTQDHGAIVFDQGRVVHAQFGMHTGEKAFAKLVMAARRDPGSHFCFSRLDRLPTDLPTTIQSDCSIWSDFLLPLMR